MSNQKGYYAVEKLKIPEFRGAGPLAPDWSSKNYQGSRQGEGDAEPLAAGLTEERAPQYAVAGPKPRGARDERPQVTSRLLPLR
jgi:hypothetical protein